MQRLSTVDVVPNHLLCRMIYDWSASSGRMGLTGANEASPSRVTPDCYVKMMFIDLTKSGNGSTKILKQLGTMAKLSYSSKKVISEPGNVDALCNFLFSSVKMSNRYSISACEEALSLLVLLPVNSLRDRLVTQPKDLSVLSWFLCNGGLNARINAALLLTRLAFKETTDDEDLIMSIGATVGVFEGLVELLKEELHCRAVITALKACLSLLNINRNIVKAVEAGLAFTIIELLVKWTGKNLQSVFKLLENVCSTPKGLAGVSTHALTIPVLTSFIILKESDPTVQNSISSLWTLCNQSGRMENAAGMKPERKKVSWSTSSISVARTG